MNRRDALKRVAIIGVGIAVAPSVLAETLAPKSPEVRGHGEFGVLAVEMTIYDMIKGTQRKVSVEDRTPVLVAEGKKPFAVSLAEEDDNYLSLLILKPNGKEFRTERQIFVGKVGHQIFLDRGVVLGFVTHDE